LRATSDTQAITQALTEALMNRDVDTRLGNLLRKGRGRFVDIYR
jgi:hypothetical protein